MGARLIIGLGNPGTDYQQTRHNAGFLLLDQLIARFHLQERGSKRAFLLWQGPVADMQVYLMKPLTYMNLSGEALAAFQPPDPIPLEDILVAYDDVALPLGTIRLRPSGSDGGQKGIRHIIQTLGTQTIPRMRLGVSSDAAQSMSLPDFVLSPFTEAERPLLQRMILTAADAVEDWLKTDIRTVMNQYNGPVADAGQSDSNVGEKVEEIVE